MKPLIWINGGEYLVGEHIEGLFPDCDVWVPAKDTGTDLLVSRKSDRRKTAGVQVKYSKDFLPSAQPVFQNGLLARGWFNLPASKAIKTNNADVWVLALYSWELRRPKCLVLKPAELILRLKNLGLDGKLNLCITKDGEHCFAENGIPRAGLIKAASGDFQPLLNGKNDFSGYLENWKELEQVTRSR
jgi:hypothetical protein